MNASAMLRIERRETHSTVGARHTLIVSNARQTIVRKGVLNHETQGKAKRKSGTPDKTPREKRCKFVHCSVSEILNRSLCSLAHTAR
ncbi:hypothetical protein [Pararobbsia silviterrae]|uniref:hypothetical protein n=1 Tax=Pararobbsia silviterrae TaxID=1792498 RepID=UPI0011C3B1B4|nr:hypothetical protein [Pararobbsia silviterrae]